MGFRNDGAAQGGIVDDKDGNWYCFVFQDHGAVGRTPVVSTMTWEDGWPVVGVKGKVPTTARFLSRVTRKRASSQATNLSTHR